MGVAVGIGGRVYVCDYFNHRVQIFSPSGKYLGRIGKGGEGEGEGEGEQEGELYLPRGVGLLEKEEGKEKREYIYISDSGDNSVKCFTEEGNFLRSWGGFVDPTEVVVGGGRVFVVDSGNHRIVELE